MKERPEENESMNHRRGLGKATVEVMRKEWSAWHVERRWGGWRSLCKEEAMSNKVRVVIKIDLEQGS